MPISVIDGTGDGPAATTTAIGEAPADAAEVVIEVSGLRMSCDGCEAVGGIDLRVSRGQIFAFLGPNGAGRSKTSTSKDLTWRALSTSNCQ